MSESKIKVLVAEDEVHLGQILSNFLAGRGYAVNTVVDQVPAAGTVVVDTGAPTITLTLERNKAYAQLGIPSNGAPYNGTRVLMPAVPQR